MTIIQQQVPCVLRTNAVSAIRECHLHRDVENDHHFPEPSRDRAPARRSANKVYITPKYDHDQKSIFRPIICEERSAWCPPLYRNTTLLSSPSQGYYYNALSPSLSSSSSSLSSSDIYTKEENRTCQHLPFDFIPPRHSFLSSSSSSSSSSLISDDSDYSSYLNDDHHDDDDDENKNTSIRSKRRNVVISSPTHQAVKLQANDIVCGRGAPTNFHRGNQSYRELIKEYETSYLCSKRSDKPHIAMKVLDILKGRGARFVKREKEGNGRMIWVEISEQRAYEKVCQSLREGAPEMRRRMLSSCVKKFQQEENRYENDEDRSVAGVSSEQVLYTDESQSCRERETYSPIPLY